MLLCALHCLAPRLQSTEWHLEAALVPAKEGGKAAIMGRLYFNAQQWPYLLERTACLPQNYLAMCVRGKGWHQKIDKKAVPEALTEHLQQQQQQTKGNGALNPMLPRRRITGGLQTLT